MDAVAVAANAPVQVGLLNLDSYNLAKKIALDLSVSDLIPARYQQKPANCLIALNMANRIGADPLMVMQNLYIVHGTPAWSAQFLIAAFNSTPGFSKLRYEFKGEEGTDAWSCRAWAVEKIAEARLDGAWVSIALAKKEGWYGKNGSKWQTMPQQMLMYRAAAWFVRAYAPEIAMGLQTREEVSDTYELEQGEDGVYATKQADPADDLNAKVFEERQPATPAPNQPRTRPTKEEMEQRRTNTKAELERLGVFDDVTKVMSTKGHGPWRAWNTGQCNKALEIGRELAEQQAETGQDDTGQGEQSEPESEQETGSGTVPCPNRLHEETGEPMMVLATVCDACKDRADCPSWK